MISNVDLIVKEFFDQDTCTVSYVVYRIDNPACIIIDPVLNYDPKSGRTSTKSADKIIAFVREHQLSVEWILETHAHADHLTAAAYIKGILGGTVAISNQITSIQKVFKGIFNLGDEFQSNGAQFDYLLQDDEVIEFGYLRFKAISVPGHTPACMAYVIEDVIFVGDTLFMPDVGSARCDFPGGDPRTLFRSIQKILSYPENTRLFLSHDYPPPSRSEVIQTTVAEQKLGNIHAHDGVSESQFIKMRTERDASLQMPILILPAIQVNIRAGNFPPAETNGVSYLKIPINAI